MEDGRKGFIILFVVLQGNMKRILCSDWLPERGRFSVLPALIPRKKIIAWSGLTKFVNFGQCR